MNAGAAANGLLVCHACALLNRPAGGDDACARCGAALHWRKPESLARSAVFLGSAAILYIPANLLPVMESGSLFGSQNDTILSGVRFLWHSGDWLIAIIIFIASIILPGVKIGALAWLLATVKGRSTWQPRVRARIYRVMEVVGRWSMVDIFVAGLLVALVQFKTIAVISIGPGALAFAAVVVLTLFASMSFDPRLIWDALDARHE
jgi:paraquat-inducible protein A